MSGDGASFDAVAYARDAFSRSRASDALSTSTLDDVALLAEGARRMESLIRDEVVSKRETLDRTLGGVREAEMTLDVGVRLVLELGAVVVIHVDLVLVSAKGKAEGNAAEGDVLPHRSAGCAQNWYHYASPAENIARTRQPGQSFR